MTQIDSFNVTKSFIEDWLFLFPLPIKVVTDRGTQFTSHKFAEMCQKYHIKHSLNLRENPTANSPVERIHRTLGNILRMSRGYDLKHVVLKASNVHNCTYHRSLDATPIEVIFGTKKFTLSLPAWLQEKNKDLKKLESNIQNKNMQNLNRSRIGLNWLNKEVMMKLTNRKKLDPVWEGPYKVIEVNQELGTVKIDKHRSHEWVSMRKLKPVGERYCSKHYLCFNFS